MKRWLTLIGVVLVIILIIGVTKALQVKKTLAGYAAMPEPQSAVSTQKAAMLDWRSELEAVGSLRAVRGVDLSLEVAGIVRNASFHSGDEVKEGQTLLQLIDDSDVAHLNSLQAAADLADVNLKRDKLQIEAEAIAKSQFDTTASNLKSARAQVAEQVALIAKKTVRAPFSGRLGISTINRGQYLNPGDKIVTLQQLDPIYVDFNLPQQSLPQVSVGQKVFAKTDSFPGLDFDGEISAIDPIVDTDTRNVRIQATLRNPDHKLLPGMFASTRIAVGETQHYLTLPQSAVTFNPYGDTVFVVVKRGEENANDPNEPATLTQTKALDKVDQKQRADDAAKAAAAKGEKPKEAAAPAHPPADPNAPPVLVARQVFVKVGPTRGDQIAITSGLNDGDEVVTSGQLKLKNGTRLNINNSITPKFDEAPKPKDE